MSPSDRVRGEDAGPRRGGLLRLTVVLFLLSTLFVCAALGALVIDPDLAYLVPGEAAPKFHDLATGLRSAVAKVFAESGPLGGVRRFAEPHLARLGLNLETALVGVGLLFLTVICIRIMAVTSRPAREDDEEEEAGKVFGPDPLEPGARPARSPYWPYDHKPASFEARVRTDAPQGGAAAGEPAWRGRPGGAVPGPVGPAARARPEVGYPAESREGFGFPEVATGDAWPLSTAAAPAVAAAAQVAAASEAPIAAARLERPAEEPPFAPEFLEHDEAPGGAVEAGSDLEARTTTRPEVGAPAEPPLSREGQPQRPVAALEEAEASGSGLPPVQEDSWVPAAETPPGPGPGPAPGLYGAPVHGGTAALGGSEYSAPGRLPAYRGRGEEELEDYPDYPAPRDPYPGPAPAARREMFEAPPARETFEPLPAPGPGPARRTRPEEMVVASRPGLGTGLRKFALPGLLLIAAGAGGAYGLQTPYAALVTSSPYASLILGGAAGVVSTLAATWFALGPMRPVARRVAVSAAGSPGDGPGKAAGGRAAPRPAAAAPALAPVPRRGAASGELEHPDSFPWAEVPKPSIFIPWSQNTTAVGVDIGSAWIKVVQTAVSRRGLELHNLGLCLTPHGAVTEAGVADPEALGAALKKLLADRNIIQRRTVAALGGQGVIVRHVHFPQMPYEELREVVRWEAEHHIPIPVGEAVIDFTIIPGEGELDERGYRQMRVMLVGAQRAAVDGYVEALRAAKLAPEGLDVEALASFRVVEAAGYALDDSVRYAQAVLDLGHMGTKLSVYLRGALELSRTLTVGGRALTTSLAQQLRVTETEAEILKRQHGVRPDGGRVFQALSRGLEDLFFEIRRSFEFFASRHFGQTVRQVYLAGGGARMPGLADALARYLNPSLDERVPEGAAVKVDILDPLAAITLSPRIVGQADLIGPEFVVALGLALGGQEILHED